MKIYKLASQNSLTTNSSGGQLLKWKVGDTYIKTSTLNKQSLATEFMYESYAEVIASRIGHKLSLDIVKYNLCKVIIDNSIETIACESKDFKSTGYKELSIGKLMQLGILPVLNYGYNENYVNLIKAVQLSFNINIKKYIDTIILFDSLILNEDRHYGNFGLLIKDKDIKLLPIFDNGNSLFCHKHTSGIEYGEDLITFLKCKPFNMNCNVQLSFVDKSYIDKQSLINLKQYIPNLMYDMVQQGLPKERAKFIKDLLFSRVAYITKL